MDVTEILTKAKQAVEDAELEGDLAAIGFTKAVDLLAGASAPARSRQAAPGGGGAASPPLVDGQGPKERLAAKLGVSVETVDSIFYLPDDDVEVVVAPSRLDATNAKATKQLALLVVAARSAVLGEEWVSVDHVRRWCEHYKKHDQSNFSAHLKAMDNTFGMRGSSRRRELRMSAVAWNDASMLAREIGGES